MDFKILNSVKCRIGETKEKKYQLNKKLVLLKDQ